MTATKLAGEKLRSVVKRIERLEDERGAIASDIRAIYAEAKGLGFDTKIMRRVVRIRQTEPAAREQERALLELYLAALSEP